jgi:Arc/MetJ family transcription regulator
MDTTLTVDEDLLVEAARLTGITRKEEIVRKPLTDLIQREAARQLIQMDGTQPDLSVPPRRRSEPA